MVQSKPEIQQLSQQGIDETLRDDILQVYLKEYENLRVSGENRVNHENQILLYTVTFTGGILAFIGAFADLAKITTSPSIMVLAWLIPIIYFALAFLSLRHISEIVEIVYYTNLILRKKIIDLLGRPVLGWDIYKVRQPRTPEFLLWPFYAARGLLFVIPGLLSIAFFAYYGPSVFNSIVILIGTLFDLLLIFAIMVFYVVSFFQWRMATSEHRNQDIL